MTVKDLYAVVINQEDDLYNTSGGKRENAGLLQFDAKYLDGLKTHSEALHETAFSDLVTLTEQYSEKGFEIGFKTAVSLLLSSNA